MDSAYAPTHSLAVVQLLWSSDPGTQNAILLLLCSALIAVVFIYIPLLVRLFRIAMLHRNVRAICQADDHAAAAHRQDIAAVFTDSPLAWQWEEFLYRWRAALVEGQTEHAPVRFAEILDERPLLPTGFRRSLLPALPGLFLAIGILGTIAGLAIAVGSGNLAESGAERAEIVGLLASQIGMALRAALWGLILAITGVLMERALAGSFEHHGECLDLWVERAFGALSPGEMANVSARSQRETLQRLAGELTRFTNDLTERMDRGLQRIEHSTAGAASLVSEEQRNVLQSVVRQLSVQVQQGVEDHLGALHGVLDRAVDHQGVVTGGLTDAFNVMAGQTEVHKRVTHTLEAAASSVDSAARSLSDTARDFGPVLDHLRDVGGTLAHTAETMDHTQEVVAHSADGVRSSIEHATAAMNEQRDFIDNGLGEIRTTLELMSNGLGENLTQALRRVDDALGHTVERLRETLGESNETIDRMAGPMRAAEGSTREMHTALERVRGEIVGLGDWLGKAIKPVRHSLGQLEERTEHVTRAMIEFGDRAHTVDKTMDALRSEIHEEGRRFRESTAELGRHLKRTADVIVESERESPPKRSAPAPRSEPKPSLDDRARIDPPAGAPAAKHPEDRPLHTSSGWTAIESIAPAPAAAPPPPQADATTSPALDPQPQPESVSELEIDPTARTISVSVPSPEADEPELEISSSDLTPADAPSEPMLSEYTTHLEISSLPSQPLPGAQHGSEPRLGDGTVGRALGPDPYSRLGEATRESRPAERDGEASDPNSLSGLLGGRPVSDADTLPDLGEEPSGNDQRPHSGTTDSSDDSADERPRSWRFLGKE